MKFKFLTILGALVLLAACAAQLTPTAPAPTPSDEPMLLPTITPRPLTDPGVGEMKKLLKRILQDHESDVITQVMALDKWVGAIYREGGTPPIDPVRGGKLTEQFGKENKVIVDLERPTYEPVWSNPAGNTSAFAQVTNAKGEEFFAHLYITSEAGGWRFTGILTRVPYYNAPSVAQLRAKPEQYRGREFMYVGDYRDKAGAPQALGAAPGDEAFVLDTWSGPIWVVRENADYAPPLNSLTATDAGKPLRVFGTVTIKDGTAYLVSDSFQAIDPASWAHAAGKIATVNAGTRGLTLSGASGGTTKARLVETALISKADGTRATFADLATGLTVDVTGTPEKDGTLLVDELYLAQ